MNELLIIGIEILALMFSYVVQGLGVMSCESLYLLQKFTFVVCIFCIQPINQIQLAAGRELWIWVTALGNKFVMLSTLAWRLLKPAHFSSPLIAVSSARQMLQSAMSKFCLSSGTKEKLIIVIIRLPLAQISSITIMIRIYFEEQGLLSGSLRIDSQGGQLRSKRQQSTVSMQRAKKIDAKIMYGDIILEIQELSALMSPFTTISCT